MLLDSPCSTAPLPRRGRTEEDNDFYIDTTTTQLYGPKEGGVWGSPVSLTGASNITNLDGNQTTVQLRRQTATAWSSSDAVLALGEPGYETDTGKEKRGDGTSAWDEPVYITDASRLPTQIVDGASLGSSSLQKQNARRASEGAPFAQHVAHAGSLSDGTNTGINVRIAQTTPCHGGELRIGIGGWYGAETNLPNSITVTAAIEYPAGSFYPAGRRLSHRRVPRWWRTDRPQLAHHVRLFLTVTAAGMKWADALDGRFGLPWLTRTGGDSYQFAALNGQRRWPVAALCDTLVNAYGINDLNSGNRSLAELQASQLAIGEAAVLRGMAAVQTTLYPWTTSTDFFATSENQTQFAAESLRLGYDRWVRAGAPIDPSTLQAVAIGTAGALLAGDAGHPYVGYFELADQVESSGDSGVWKVIRYVGDGDLTNGSETVQNASTGFVDGQAFNSSGTPAGTYITAGGGTSTLTLSLPATTTQAGIAAVVAYTSDGIHAAPVADNLLAQGVDVSLIA